MSDQPLHRQVTITHDGHTADVDAGMAGIILACWRAGLPTLASCENDNGWAWIGFGTCADADRFHRVVRGIEGARVIPITEEDAAGDPSGFSGDEHLVDFPASRIGDARRAVHRLGGD